MKYLFTIGLSLIIVTLSGQVTTLEADIFPGQTGSVPEYLTEYNGKLYFAAFDGATGGGHGTELWSYDGVTAQLVADIFPGGFFSSSPRDLIVYDSVLYFSADDGVHGRELWAFNGDSAYLFADIQLTSANGGNSEPQNFQEYNGILYFSGFKADGFYYGREMFATDGNSVWIIDISPGSSSSSPENLTVYDGKLMFSADINSYVGKELFSYNGDTVKLEADIFPGTSSSAPRYFKVVGSNLYFSAFITGIGYELWKYDGTTATLVSDIYPGTGSSNPEYLTEYYGVLYFRAIDGVTGYEMWSYDGTTLTNWDLRSGSFGAYPVDFEVYNNLLYFSIENCANNYSLNCGNSWYSLNSFDGLNFETVSNNFIHQGQPRNLKVFSNRLFFTANDGNSGLELWSYYPPSVCSTPKSLSVAPENLNTVVLSWNLEPNAIGYQIRGAEVGTSGFVSIAINDGLTTSYKAKGLFSSKTYAWQIKAICDSANESSWSSFDTFKIDDFYCQTPVNYVTDITPTSAVLRWNVISNASRYWIIGRDVNSPKLRSLNIYNGDQDSVWVQLAPGNTYVWQMRAECPAAPIVSLFTPAQYFSTPTGQAAKGELTFPIEAGVSIFPNPMDEYTIIQAESKIIELALVDLQGRVIQVHTANDDVYRLERGDLAPGMYVAIIRTEGNEYREKILIN